MPRNNSVSRTEIVIRAWREVDAAGEEAFRGSISLLSGSNRFHFIGLPQLYYRLTQIIELNSFRRAASMSVAEPSHTAAPGMAGFWLRPVMVLPPEAASLDRVRTGKYDTKRAAHLESIACAFVEGYNLMLGSYALAALRARLGQVPPALRGFLVEGAGMAAAIRDGLSTGHQHLQALNGAFGGEYRYLVQVGAGWAMARLPWLGRKVFSGLPPENFSLSLDGHGFHDTFFHPERLKGGQLARGRSLSARSYDRGIGRALWFVALGRTDLVASHIDDIDENRRGDLLAGLGLAMAYAGPADPGECAKILHRFSKHRPAYLQGIGFAAAARIDAGHVTANLAAICDAVLGRSAEEVAALVEAHHPKSRPVSRNEALAVFEVWRSAVQHRLAADETRSSDEGIRP